MGGNAEGGILIVIIGFNRPLIGELNWPMMIMMWVAKGWLCRARNRGQRVGRDRFPRAIHPIYGVLNPEFCGLNFHTRSQIPKSNGVSVHFPNTLNTANHQYCVLFVHLLLCTYISCSSLSSRGPWNNYKLVHAPRHKWYVSLSPGN